RHHGLEQPRPGKARAARTRLAAEGARPYRGNRARLLSGIGERNCGEPHLAIRPELAYDAAMTKVLEDAIEKVRKLPQDRQAYVAEVLELIAASGGDTFVVPDAHRAAVLEGLGQAERGEFVSDEEMAALWKKCGL